MLTLLAHPGFGSALIEAQLDLYGLPYEREVLDNPFSSEAARARIRARNPTGQLPTLLLPSGEVMTESAAITLHLADLTRSDLLVPGADAPERARFLRWLVFAVAQLYAGFAYADNPQRFVATDHAAFKTAVHAYREGLLRNWGEAAAAPWFLGERFSALDLHVATMTRWTPRRAWFAAHAPKLAAIAERVDAMPELAPWRERNGFL
jgi:GST-like protein